MTEKVLIKCDKVTFRDLSPWLKTAAIVSWITLGIWIIAFLIGLTA